MHSKTKIGLLTGAAVVLVAGGISAQPSPALCGSQDTPETGIQGDIPQADQVSGRNAAGYNCGLSLVSELAGGGAAQGSRHCAYVRISGGMTTGAAPSTAQLKVVDMSDLAHPAQIGTLTSSGSQETLRAVTTDQRAVLIEGSSVYDISDCEHPVRKGEIFWRGLLPWPAGLHHDHRISPDGTKVWAGMGVVEADITNLDDPSTWTVRNYTCDIAKQYNHPLHTGPTNLCDSVDWEAQPVLGHGHGLNASGTRLYVGNQTVSSTPNELPTLRVLDVTVKPPRLLGSTPGPGHSMDWFKIGGREYVLHANELVTNPTSSCLPYAARTDELGYAHNAIITDVTNEAAPTRVSRVELAISKPENCAAVTQSAQSTAVAYHSIDNPQDPHFAMVSMGPAGLRVFDIRNPAAPKEVAYFNRGALVHAGVSHYEASSGTIWIPGGDAFRVLEIQPQVLQALGLPAPANPAYPRYPNGRAARPAN